MRVFRHKSKQDGQWVPTKKWYADVHLPQGKRVALPLFTGAKLSRVFAQNLDGLIGQVESGRGLDRDTQRWLDQLSPKFLRRFSQWGLISASRLAAGAELTQHLEDYIESLRHRDCGRHYVKACHTRVAAVLSACGFRVLGDIQPSKVQKFISDEMRAGSFGQSTANYHLQATKSFLLWMVQDNRADMNPLQHLRAMKATKPGRKRRALSGDEIAFLLDWLSRYGSSAYGLTAEQRRLIYLVAVTTGLRSSEIGALTASTIDFKAKTVTLQGCYTKNKLVAVLPLRVDVLDALKVYTQGMVPGVRLFKMPQRTALMIRADLTAARLDYLAEGGQDDDFLTTNEVDFHCLRHTFGSLLAAAGVHPKTAMTLMRHSSIALTMNIYSHSYRGADVAAVDSLPSFGTMKQDKKKA